MDWGLLFSLSLFLPIFLLSLFPLDHVSPLKHSLSFFFPWHCMALHHVIYCSSWTFFLWADIISSSAYRCQPLCMLCILICKFDIPILTMYQIIFIYIMLTNDPYEYVLFLDVIVHILYMYAEKPNKFKFKFINSYICLYYLHIYIYILFYSFNEKNNL